MNTVKETASDVKHEVEKGLSALQTLRDEIRLKLHLAGMDAKERWSELETQIFDVEQSAQSAVSGATHAALDATVKKLEQFKHTLHLDSKSDAKSETESGSSDPATGAKGN